MSAPAGASRDHTMMQATGNRREAFTCIPGVRPTNLHRNQSPADGMAGMGRKSVSQLSVIDSTSGGMKRMSITSRTSAEKYNSQYFSRQASVDSRRASATVRLPKLKLEHVDSEVNAEKSDNSESQQSAQPEVVTESIKDLDGKDVPRAQTPRAGNHGAEATNRISSLMSKSQGPSSQTEAGVGLFLAFYVIDLWVVFFFFLFFVFFFVFLQEMLLKSMLHVSKYDSSFGFLPNRKGFSAALKFWANLSVK